MVSIKRKERANSANSDEEYVDNESPAGDASQPYTKKAHIDDVQFTGEHFQTASGTFGHPQHIPTGAASQTSLPERSEVGIITEAELYKNGSIREPTDFTKNQTAYSQYAPMWQITKDPSVLRARSNSQTCEQQITDLDRSGEVIVNVTLPSLDGKIIFLLLRKWPNVGL